MTPVVAPDERGEKATSDVRLESLLKAQAYAFGFDLAGIATLGPVETAAAFDAWIARGYAGEMQYLERGAEKRRDARLPVPGATSAVVVAMNYGGTEPSGPVARYARGGDYHEVMIERLRALHGWLSATVGRHVSGKAYVDTGPILERDLARRAGLGWFGKNTNLINPEHGSFFFLGALLVELDLAPDTPFEADRCGTCTRCLDACPTAALTAPRELDATRCISYLTIELKGVIPEALRAGIGELVYGCDICQEVCPWNVRFASELNEEAFVAREFLAGKDARQLRGLTRNAAVVLGNVGTEEDVDVLTRALDNADPLVREHAAWALARLDDHDGTTR